eukprot:scaffold207140_cov20-Tisochrysis_lutea.AAC.1
MCDMTAIYGSLSALSGAHRRSKLKVTDGDLLSYRTGSYRSWNMLPSLGLTMEEIRNRMIGELAATSRPRHRAPSEVVVTVLARLLSKSTLNIRLPSGLVMAMLATAAATSLPSCALLYQNHNLGESTPTFNMRLTSGLVAELNIALPLDLMTALSTSLPSGLVTALLATVAVTLLASPPKALLEAENDAIPFTYCVVTAAALFCNIANVGGVCDTALSVWASVMLFGWLLTLCFSITVNT